MDRKEIANEILQQLGGARVLRVMLGADNFFALDSGGYGLQFNLKAIGRPRINKIRIKVVNDLYDIEAFFITRAASSWNKPPVASAKGVYNSDLINVLEQMTGLVFRLPRIMSA